MITTTPLDGQTPPRSVWPYNTEITKQLVDDWVRASEDRVFRNFLTPSILGGPDQPDRGSLGQPYPDPDSVNYIQSSQLSARLAIAAAISNLARYTDFVKDPNATDQRNPLRIAADQLVTTTSLQMDALGMGQPRLQPQLPRFLSPILCLNGEVDISYSGNSGVVDSCRNEDRVEHWQSVFFGNGELDT